MNKKPALIVNNTSRPFWDAVARHELLLQYDPTADRYQFYPRPIGLHTTTALQWRKASGNGTLVAATRTHFAAPGFAEQVPYWEGLVRLDEGPRIFAPLGDTGTAWLPGTRMRIAWPAPGASGHPFWFEAIPG
ncbi:Zn-ribbon domain-containing OB-fold protein [Bordetella sp. BOR01]|uniref:Zn-ribbon domain-containing OB-fold protein n=1 Tax=Bordetella sp. BOR01 TaxID=2854779 RepID=UPI001C491C2C|nr:OB-fold domain-containing protein [Bordetella sp. BOR01]MBV7484781.1 OB-fold domain-containing protein [Bordetella sp. BOR01]